MEQKEKDQVKMPLSGPKKLPLLLKYYNNASFSMQMKARFIYYLGFTCIASITIVILVAFYLQLISPEGTTFNIPAFLGETFLLLFFLLSFFLLIKGWYLISSNLIIVATLICIWFITIVDTGETVTRIDNIVYLFAILSMLPLTIIKNKFAVLFYILFNLVCIYSVILFFDLGINLTKLETVDFLADATIALVFMGIVSYNTHHIHKMALDKAESDIDQKNIAEEALARSEKKYREMTDLLPQIVFESDINGTLTYINKSGYPLFGYSEDDFKKGINIISTIHPDDRERVKANIKKLMGGSESRGNEYAAIKKNGDSFPVQIFSSVIEENQKILGFRGIIIDISDRKKADEEIKVSRDQFQSLVSNIPGITYRCLNDKDWTMLFISSEIDKLSGYPAEDFIMNKTRTFGSLIYPEDKDYANQLFSEAVEGSMPWEYEYRIVKSDGTIRWVYEKGKAIYNTKGQIEFLDGFILDITEKKIAEKELLESERKYRTLMEKLNETVMMVDHDDRVLFVNKKFTEKLGYLPEEIIGKIGYETLLNPEDHSKIKDANLERIKNKSGQYEITFTGKNGQKIDFLVSGAPLFDAEGNSIGSIGAMTDITEKNKTEKELEKYRENLELLVKERTEALETINEELIATNDELYSQREELKVTISELNHTQNQLIESEKMASLGILAAGIAHEINNPLNFIQAGVFRIENYFTENLESHLTKIAPMVENINTGVERVAKIVTSLNHFSRSTDSLNETCNIHEIIDNCLVMLQNQLKFKIEIVKNYTNTTIEITGNGGKLHQAFLNIISNAQQAIPDSGFITISTKADNKFVLITISDTGSGIKKEHLSQIFNPFFTTKDPGKGTGLGLSITYKIIQEHGGKIEYLSEIGKGTTAIVKLPFKPNSN